ncbi:hypothetical protein FACS189493_4750 [Spirochaetia bacterium]|nr:hypothetical protein FACS189493_4750 [Spirochaetia bacterium]
MTVVLDVSGAAQVVFNNKEKHAKFQKVLDGADMIIAPDLYISELTNTLWKYYRARVYDYEKCCQYIQAGISLIDEFIDSKVLWQEAFKEGTLHDHPIYDMYYAILARRRDGILITNDGELAKLCKKLSINYLH